MVQIPDAPWIREADRLSAEYYGAYEPLCDEPIADDDDIFAIYEGDD